MNQQIKPIFIEVSPGELYDKITILQIKTQRIKDPSKLVHVNAELASLSAVADDCIQMSDHLAGLIEQLRQSNLGLFEVIEAIYACEAAGEPWERYVELARSVYRLNDARALFKRRINLLLGSDLLEEKAHMPCDAQQG